MKDTGSITSPQKMFLYTGLMTLGIFSNTPFFLAVVALLGGTTVLGYFRRQLTQPMLLTSHQSTKEVEQVPITHL